MNKIFAEAIGVGGARFGRHCLSFIMPGGDSLCIEIAMDTLLALQRRLEELNPVALARIAIDRPLINETEVEGPVLAIIAHRHEEDGVCVDEKGFYGEDEQAIPLGPFLENEYQKSRSTTSDPAEIHMYEESLRDHRGSWSYTDYDPEKDEMGKAVGM